MHEKHDETPKEAGRFGFLSEEGQIVRAMQRLRAVAAMRMTAQLQCPHCATNLLQLATLWRCPGCYAMWPLANATTPARAGCRNCGGTTKKPSGKACPGCKTLTRLRTAWIETVGAPQWHVPKIARVTESSKPLAPTLAT